MSPRVSVLLVALLVACTSTEPARTPVAEPVVAPVVVPVEGPAGCVVSTSGCRTGGRAGPTIVGT